MPNFNHLNFIDMLIVMEIYFAQEIISYLEIKG